MNTLYIFVILLGIVHEITGNEVTLEYYENDEVTIVTSDTQIGSYANLGVYHHWCLGNIFKCHHGITVGFWVNAAAVTEDSEDIVFLTSGGESYSSYGGVYLLQRFGDQYEFGVSREDQVWKINFRLYADMWVKVHAVWDVKNGLSLSVDNLHWSQPNPETRDYFPGDFDTFAGVVVGLTEYRLPLDEDELFQLRHIVIHDHKLNSSDDGDTFEYHPSVEINQYSSSKVETLAYPGCISETEDVGDFSPVDIFGEENPIEMCRQLCGDKLSIALLSNGSLCSCAKREVLSKLDTRNGSCDDDAVWRVFGASGVNEHNPYSLTVGVKTLQTRDYVKPMETVVIEIKPNHIAEAVYEVDFGDGVVVNTGSTSVNHFWAVEGVYTIRARSRVGIFSFESQVNFEVRDVDENTAPEMVELFGTHDETQQMRGYFDLYLADKTDHTQCDIVFSDNQQKMVYDATKSTDQYFYHKLFEHTFTTYGQYLVSTNCRNNYGFDSSSLMFLSKRFDIPFSYNVLGETFSVEMAGGPSFVSDIEVIRNHQTPLSVTKTSKGITVPASQLKPFENIISLQLNDDIFHETILFMENVPTNASIIPDYTEGAWTLTTNISVLIPPGNNMFVTCTFGLGEEEHFYIYEAKQPVTLPFQVEYDNLGYYRLTVAVSNDKDLIEVEDLISVEVPIYSINLHVKNITDKDDPVILGVDLNQGAQGPDKVTFEIDNDDGNIISYDYRSSSLFFTRYNNSYVYQDWGIYNICVSASNSISRVFHCILVQVGQNITYMDLKTTTIGRVKTTEYAELNMTVLSGSDITYTLDFGDDKLFIFTDRDFLATNETASYDVVRVKRETNSLSPDTTTTSWTTVVVTTVSGNDSDTEEASDQGTSLGPPRSIATKQCSCVITVRHKYSNPGYYEVKANITNAFTSASAVLCPYIIVDDSDDTMCGDTTINLPGYHTSRGQPHVHMRSVDMRVDVQTRTPNCDGSGFQYTWKAVQIFSDRETPYDDFCTLEQNDNIFIVPGVSLHFGFYKFVVTAAPVGHKRRASQVEVYVRIVPSNPIAHFKGDEEETFFNEGIFTLDFTESHDPDLTSHIREGIEFDLICFQKKDYDSLDEMEFNALMESNVTQLLIEDVIYVSETMNPLRIYQYGDCLTSAEEFQETVDISNSMMTTSTSLFTSTDTVFSLIVSKEGRISTISKIVKKILDDYDKQMDMLTNAQFLKDTTQALDIVNKIGPGVIKSNDSDAQEKQDQLKELALTVVAAVTSYAKDMDTINRVAQTCEIFTTEEVTDTAREKAASAISSTGKLVEEKFANQDNSALESTLGDQVKTLSNVAPTVKAKTKEEKLKLRCKRRADPDAPDEDVETAVKYEALVKAGDLLGNPILRDLYDFLFHHYAEFRSAVRRRIDNVKLPQAVLKEKPVDLFMRLGLEWDPFDIQNVILDACEIELALSIQRTKLADKEVQAGSAGAMASMSGLVLNNFEKERCRRRRRRKRGVHGPDKQDKMVVGTGSGIELTIEMSEGVGIFDNIAKRRRRKRSVDPCNKYDEEDDAAADGGSVGGAQPGSTPVVPAGTTPDSQGVPDATVGPVVGDKVTDGVATTKGPVAVTTGADVHYDVTDADDVVDRYTTQVSTVHGGSDAGTQTSRPDTGPGLELTTKSTDGTVTESSGSSGITDGQTGTGSASGTDGQTGTGSGSGTDGQTDTVTDSGTQTGTGSGSGTDGQTGTDSGSGTDGQTGTGSGSGTDGQTGTGSGSGTDGQTDTVTDSGTQTGTGSDSGTDGETGTDDDFTDEATTGVVNAVNKENPFTYGSNSDRVSSEVSSIDLIDPALGEPIQIEDSEEEMPILVKSKCEVATYNATIRQAQGAERVRIFHSITMDNNGSSLHFRITSREHWDTTVFQICLVYNVSTPDPACVHSARLPLGEDAFPDIKHTNHTQWLELRNTYFPPQNVTAFNGEYTVTVSLESSHVDFSQTITEVVYDYQLWTSGCLFWDPINETFISNGTRVSNLTTPEVTVCLTTHLTSFGGDFAVPPNTIDFNNVWAKFKNLNENAAVFSTVVSLLGVYILLLIWARYMDKKDVQKWGASPLDDNLPSDNYHYQLTIQTGVRKLAATNSKVSFILSGEESDTGVRRLYDGQRKVFERGSILNFILSVESSLGPLNFMRIWHDNNGKGKMRSWYLDQTQVTDLQTGERYFFLCDRWLAVEEDDGMVDRILPVAGLEDLAAFKQLFSSSVKKKITNDHLWFSVFSRPTRSNFTRVQRISCCMSLLFMTMITNAMWFKSEDKTQNTNAMKIGPISFTLQQLFVSFASTMLVFPVNFVLMTFFRKCRPKKNGIMHKNQMIPKRGKWKSVAASQSQTWDRVPMKSRWQRFKESIANFVNFQRHKSKYESEPDPDDCVREMKIAGIPEAGQKKKKKKKPGSLPHWCIYIAWILCFFSITSSGFFTILYSMEWGPEKANEWLTTFLMSFFQSVIVVQPIKVFVLVAFIACVLKKPDLDDEDPGEDLNNVIAAHDEEFTAKSNTAIDEIALRRKMANSDFQPPDMTALDEARHTRMMEMKMEEVVKEIGVYAFFVLILFFLSYQTRDADSFLMGDNLKTSLASGFDKIATVEDYWKWLDNTLLPNLYATEYENGDIIKPWWDKRCIKDLESRRVGLPRIRQLRVKENTCVVNPALKPMIKHCRDDYGWTDDDAKDYIPGWKKIPEENRTALQEEKSPWIYQNSVQLKSAPYMGTMSTYKGGGYVALFERNLTWTKRIIDQLKKDVWMDVYTRGVFLEFAVYNPNINLFSSAVLLIEFVASGGAIARTEFKVFRLLSYVGGMGILVIIFEVIYACFTLYFFIRCIKKLRKEKMKYLGRFWNLLEFMLLCFCVAVIAMYALKKILSEVTMRALKDPDKADYVNFRSMSMYDELFGWMMACVVFLATIQFLKLLQFNRKMNMLGDTIKLATKDLKVFSIAFALYFFAFTACGHLLFGNTLISYSSLVSSAESMFAFTLGDFDFGAMADVNKVLGPLFFFTFVGVVYVGLMSMFFTIIGDAFTEVKATVDQGKNDYEIVGFIWKRMKGIMGLT